jgi:hypothetical protein
MMEQQADSSTQKTVTKCGFKINSTEEELKRWAQSSITEIINAVAAYFAKQKQQEMPLESA